MGLNMAEVLAKVRVPCQFFIDDLAYGPPQPQKENASVPLCAIGNLILDGVAEPVNHRFVKYSGGLIRSKGTECFQQATQQGCFLFQKSSCLVSFQQGLIPNNTVSVAFPGGGNSDTERAVFTDLAKKAAPLSDLNDFKRRIADKFNPGTSDKAPFVAFFLGHTQIEWTWKQTGHIQPQLSFLLSQEEGGLELLSAGDVESLYQQASLHDVDLSIVASTCFADAVFGRGFINHLLLILKRYQTSTIYDKSNAQAIENLKKQATQYYALLDMMIVLHRLSRFTDWPLTEASSVSQLKDKLKKEKATENQIKTEDGQKYDEFSLLLLALIDSLEKTQMAALLPGNYESTDSMPITPNVIKELSQFLKDKLKEDFKRLLQNFYVVLSKI